MMMTSNPLRKLSQSFLDEAMLSAPLPPLPWPQQRLVPALLSVLLLLVINATTAHDHYSHGHGPRSLQQVKDTPFGKAALAALDAMGAEAVSRVAKAHKLTPAQLRQILATGG